MTRAEIISLTRDLVNEISTDAGALLSDTGNLLEYVNAGMEDVVLDLMPSMKSVFMRTKMISLVADQAAYSLAQTITGTTIALVTGTPPTITDSGSGFVTAGFAAGMSITVSGSTADDGDYLIETVVAGTLTLDAADTMTGEIAGASITITQKDPSWMIYKVERNVTDQPPREIEIIDPLDFPFAFTVGDTEASPTKCYFQGDDIYFVKTPSTTTSNYAKVYLLRPEAVTLPTTGPKYLPRPTHRMIAYKAAMLAATSIGANVAPFIALYEMRKNQVANLYRKQFQQKTRHVRDDSSRRNAVDDREKVFYDPGWE